MAELTAAGRVEELAERSSELLERRDGSVISTEPPYALYVPAGRAMPHPASLASRITLPASCKKIGEYQERGQPTLRIDGVGGGTFLQFATLNSKEALVGYFRAVLKALEVDRGLEAYHLKVMSLGTRGSARLSGSALETDGLRTALSADAPCEWELRVFFGGDREAEKAGPLEVPICMSCELECPLHVGVGAGHTELTSRDTALAEFEHHRAWIDAKARPLFVVTPKRHVRRLAELSDDELVGFWRAAAEVMQQNALGAFQSMILNHGKFQNHAHLHLKIRLPPRDFHDCVRRWSPDVQATFRRLEAFVRELPPESQGRGPPRKPMHERSRSAPCRLYAQGRCSYGAHCRFAHEQVAAHTGPHHHHQQAHQQYPSSQRYNPYGRSEQR